MLFHPEGLEFAKSHNQLYFHKLKLRNMEMQTQLHRLREMLAPVLETNAFYKQNSPKPESHIQMTSNRLQTTGNSHLLQRKSSAPIKYRTLRMVQISPFRWNGIPVSTAPQAQRDRRCDG